MPVLVTGATGMVGRALVRRLVAEGGQVRAYVRRDDAALRASGAHLAIGAADDVPRLEAALTRVHTIVHLVGGIWPAEGLTYDWLNRETTEAAVIAARAAGARRFLFLSFPGADPASPNEFLAAKGKAEEHIRSSGLEHAVFRCAPILGEGSEIARACARLRRGPLVVVPGDGRQRVNPISVEDVIDALVAADAREAEVRGTWELGGPDTMSMDEVVEVVAGPRRKIHLGLLSSAPPALAEVYGRDIVADTAGAASHFGLALSASPRYLGRGTPPGGE